MGRNKNNDFNFEYMCILCVGFFKWGKFIEIRRSYIWKRIFLDIEIVKFWRKLLEKFFLIV